MKYKPFLILGFGLLVLWNIEGCDSNQPPSISGTATPSNAISVSVQSDDSWILEAYQKGQSGIIVQSQGAVSKLLSDDEKGSRHQRFILHLNNGISILMTHNIDIAPRIEDLNTGDEVKFRGRYEWNNKGGVVHWTHHDPNGRRYLDGWLEHNGRKYE